MSRRKRTSRKAKAGRRKPSPEPVEAALGESPETPRLRKTSAQSDDVESPAEPEPRPEQLMLWSEESVGGAAEKVLAEKVFGDLEIERRAPLIAVHPLAILLGLAAGWQWLGMRLMLYSIIEPLPTTSTMYLVVALLAAAAGPWIPERLVMALTRFLKEKETFRILQAVHQRDPAMVWSAIGVMAVVSGLISLLTLALGGLAVAGQNILIDNFFWTNLAMTVVEWAGSFLFLGPAWALQGLLLVMLMVAVGLRSHMRDDSSGILAGLVVGVAGACWSYRVGMRWGLSAGQFYILGSLPLFVLAFWATRYSQAKSTPLKEPLDEEAPELSAGAEGTVWLSLVVWGMCLVLVWAGWLNSLSLLSGSSGVLALGWICLLMGVGLYGAAWYMRGRITTLVGCGMSLWAMGVASSMAATLSVFWPAGGLSAAIQVLCLSLPAGYSLYYIKKSWLARAGSETAGHAQMISALLAGMGVGLIVSRWLAMPSLGPIGLMAGGSLGLLALGGMIQIYESTQPIRRRHQRLALIFGSLAGVVVLFPLDARQWVRLYHQPGVVAGRPQTLEPLDVPLRIVHPQVCLIGLETEQAIQLVDPSRSRVALAELAAPVKPSPQLARKINPCTIISTTAFRHLRMNRQPYDLIYLYGDLAASPEHRALCSLEWLSQIAGQTAVGGMVVLDIPSRDISERARRMVAVTFARVMGPDGCYRIAGDAGGHEYLRLIAVPRGRISLTEAESKLWRPLEELCGEPVPIHSGRNARLIHALNRNLHLQ